MNNLKLKQYFFSSDDEMFHSKYYKRGYVFNAPNLRRLTLGNLMISCGEYSILLERLPNLSHLDLSNNYNIGGFCLYSLVPNLVSLNLYNVKLNTDAPAFVENVRHLRNLRYSIYFILMIYQNKYVYLIKQFFMLAALNLNT